jgi:hypothetical protein
VLAEFHRTLSPGDHLMLACHVGDDEHLRPTQDHGNRQVSYGSYLLSPERIVELLDRARLVITVRLVQEPVEGTKRTIGTLWLGNPHAPRPHSHLSESSSRVSLNPVHAGQRHADD